MPDKILSVQQKVILVDDKVVMAEIDRCWPECLFVYIKGAGIYAPGEPGQVVERWFAAKKSVFDFCKGQVCYTSSFVVDGQYQGVTLRFGSNLGYAGTPGSCGDFCNSPGNYGIMLTFWLDYQSPFFSSYIPHLRDVVVPQGFPFNPDGALPNHYWDDCLYCRNHGGPCFPDGVEGLEYDLCTDIGWFGLVFWHYTGIVTLNPPAVLSGFGLDNCNCPRGFIDRHGGGGIEEFEATELTQFCGFL